MARFLKPPPPPQWPSPPPQPWFPLETRKHAAEEGGIATTPAPPNAVPALAPRTGVSEILGSVSVPRFGSRSEGARAPTVTLMTFVAAVAAALILLRFNPHVRAYAAALLPQLWRRAWDVPAGDEGRRGRARASRLTSRGPGYGKVGREEDRGPQESLATEAQRTHAARGGPKAPRSVEGQSPAPEPSRDDPPADVGRLAADAEVGAGASAVPAAAGKCASEAGFAPGQRVRVHGLKNAVRQFRAPAPGLAEHDQ